MVSFGGDEMESLTIGMRLDTQAFVQDFKEIQDTLEKGLLGAIRKGSMGFDDLRRIALRVIDDIASQALGGMFPGGSGAVKGGIGGLLNLGGLLGSVLGLPGRATGGNVAPGRGYLVGERGPELFIPTAAGRVESNMAAAGGAREVRVSINVTTPQGGNAPQALQRSARQVASAVRRALATH
jgi:phage-related minor tail protein